MQPTYLEPLGSVNFSKFKTDISLRNTTQIVFSSSSATVCLYDIHKLECFRDSPNWSHQFTWIPVLDLKYLLDNVLESPDDLYNWHISKVIFVNTSTTARQSLAAVLVNTNQNRSLVCFFRSLSTAKCNIAILINGAITSLEWLPLIDIGCKSSESHSMNSTMDITDQDTSKGTNKTLSSVLSIFDGCFALGFQQGLVGLLDMCLTHTRDDLSNDQPETSIAVERSHCLHCFSCKQPISQPSDDNVEHSLVYLDASVLRWNDFTYKSVSGKTLSSIPSAGVYVSALSYIPQLQGLAVGFSFGGWQLWSLDRLNMEFCLRQATPATPVVSFNFLEPSDDPRFCCFIWVGWQSKQETESDGVFKFTGKQNSIGNFQSPTVKLFQLSYRRRYELFSNKHKEFNFYYQDLIGIAERLSTTLSGDKIDDNKPQYTSRLLSVQSLHAPGDFIMDNNNNHHPNHTTNNTTIINHSVGMIRLIAFIWKFSESIIRIGLFDLDRWYHAQMPTYIRSDDTFVSIFDALIPNQKVQLLHTYLIESSLMSFWSRIVQRESNLIKSCQLYPIQFKPNHINHYHYKRSRPIPEVFLRPSSLSFHCLLFWTNDTSNHNSILNFSITQPNRHRTTTTTTTPIYQYYDCVYHLSRIMFVSCQEECIIELNRFTQRSLSMSSLNVDQSPYNKKFNLIQWLSNAWRYGLLESPGLDQLDDEEFINLLNYTQNTTLISSNRNYTTDNNDYGIHLTIGDYYDQSMIDSLNRLLCNLTTEQLTNHPLNMNHTHVVDDDVDDDDDDCIPSKRHSKYRRIDQSMNVHSIRIRKVKKKYQYSLDPCWVLLANCCLEHGCINVLKNLDNLSPPGQDSPVNLNFKYSWIWLRFCRLKSRFDKLTSVLFMPKSSDEAESVLSNSTDHGHSRIPDLLELGCTINQIQLLATLSKHWFIGKNYNSTTTTTNSPRLHLSTSRQHPIEISIKTYLSYAKLVVFLFRLGLLPQTDERLNDNKFSTDSFYRVNSTVLLPYNSSMLTETISELRCTRHHPVDLDMNNNNNNSNDCNTNRLTSLSEHILYASLQAPSKHFNNSNCTNDNSFTNNEVYDIWKEQEHLTSSLSSSSSAGTSKPINSSHHSNRVQSSLNSNELPDWLSYPPKNLQSMCALWQLPYNRQIKKSRLILLGFILCDSAAETLLHSNDDEYLNDLLDQDHTDISNNNNNDLVNSNGKVQTTQMIDHIKSTNSSSLRALQLCRYVMSLFIKEFPTVYSLVPTIISLWLMDRGYFQESISSDIMSFIMNSSEIPSSYQIHSDIFPNQIHFIIHLFNMYGQGDLIHDLLKHLTNNNNSSSLNYNSNNLKVPLSFRQFFNKTSTITPTPTPPNSITMNHNNNNNHKFNMKPIGAPYLALSKLRNLIYKMNRLHNQTPLPIKVLNSIDKLARNSFIQLTEICRQAGRLSDLISLGLNSWEAKVLFEYYEKTGQQNLLFHCLIARSHYQTAMDILNNNNNNSTNPIHSTIHTLDNDNNDQRFQVELMKQLIHSCLPLLNLNELNHKSAPLDHFKALANEYVNLDDYQTNSESSSFIHRHHHVDDDDDDQHHLFTQSQSSLPSQMDHRDFITYKQTTPLIYPLTDLKKPKQPTPSSLSSLSLSNKYPLNSHIGNQYFYDNMDDNNNNNNHHNIEDDMIRNNRIHKSNSWLLTTNKKSRQEFWNTFKELQDLHESCGLNSNIWLNDSRCRLMDYTTTTTNNNTTTANSTVTTPTQPVNLNESRLKLNRKREYPLKDDDLDKYLFKCIYTPPSCRRKQSHSNTVTNRLIPSSNSLFNNSISSPFNQKPISILKTKICSSNKEISASTMADSMKTTITTTTTAAVATIVSSSSSSLFSTSLNPIISSSTSISPFPYSTLTTNVVTSCSNVKDSSYLMKENNLLNMNNNTTHEEISSNIHDNDDDCNVDENDDCDVTLNLSTVRPSIVNIEKFQHNKLLQDNVNNKCNEFTFSAPRRISLTSSNTPIINKSMEKNEFLFSAPLINKSAIKPNQSIENDIDKVTVLPISMNESNQCSYTTINNNDNDSYGSTSNSDQLMNTSKIYFMDLDNTPSLTKAPIFTPPKLQNPAPILDQIHTNETIHDQLTNNDIDNKEDITPRVAVKSRKKRDHQPHHKTSTHSSQLTTESIFDHLNRLHQEQNHYPTHQSIDMDDFDDTSSVTSSMTDSSETVRRSTRRVRPPKRYDSSAV
ncbi:unnamed protein product [Schistosoma rodhaini]|uniref:ELYS-bb domain-containing protein n=1 Tax=Schistosoma mansoni TaxID=6183 RepID=A0A5K4FBS5_SCHMA|nr:unnamed protein product [Schistosoma rodhaini]